MSTCRAQRTLHQRSQLLSLLDQQATQSPTELRATLQESLLSTSRASGEGNLSAQRAPSTREVHLQDPPAVSPFEEAVPRQEVMLFYLA